MVPIRILIAALLTLVIILDKILEAYNFIFPKVYKFGIGILYGITLFFWNMVIFGTSTAWYAYGFSIIMGICAFIYYYFVYLYNKKETITPNGTIDFNSFIGKEGKVNQIYEDGYIGNFSDTNEMVFIYSIDKLELNDMFTISEIKDGKIYAVKKENNIN